MHLACPAGFTGSQTDIHEEPPHPTPNPTPPVLSALSQPSVPVLPRSFGASHVAAKPKIVWGSSADFKRLLSFGKRVVVWGGGLFKPIMISKDRALNGPFNVTGEEKRPISQFGVSPSAAAR